MGVKSSESSAVILMRMQGPRLGDRVQMLAIGSAVRRVGGLLGELVCLSVPVSETSVVRRLTQTFSLFSAWKCKLNVRLPLVCAEEEGGREGERERE